jgi:predicted component of type VI protein secretion system
VVLVVGALQRRYGFPMPAEVSHHSTVDVGAEAETRDATCVIFLVPLGAVSVVLRAGEVLSVGRSSAADVCLDDASVSRVHARLSLIDGSVHVHDAGSRNGVWVNGQRVQRHTIGTQDRVRIGGVGLMVVESGDAAPQQAAFRAKQ